MNDIDTLEVAPSGLICLLLSHLNLSRYSSIFKFQVHRNCEFNLKNKMCCFAQKDQDTVLQSNSSRAALVGRLCQIVPAKAQALWH